jgi:hypothetical protein
MNTTLNIIPLSAIRDAFAQHEEDNGVKREDSGDAFDDAICGGPFTFGDADITLVSVKKFVKEWPEYEAAVFNVLSSDEDYKCAEPAYVDLES